MENKHLVTATIKFDDDLVAILERVAESTGRTYEEVCRVVARDMYGPEWSTDDSCTCAIDEALVLIFQEYLKDNPNGT